MNVLEGKRAGAIIVAHPDDEALWFGGLPAHTDLAWYVICCTIPRRDPERAFKFYQACWLMNAVGRVLPFVEPEPGSGALVGLGLIEFGQFDVVATHNEVGEYGHVHHRAVHQHVREHFRGPVLTPGYGMEPGPEVIELTPGERVKKLAAIMAYDHIPEGTNCTKGDALLARYGKQFDLWRETYHVH